MAESAFEPTLDGTALLCLDVQPLFLRAIGNADAVLQRCRFAVAAAVGLNLPVIFTEQVPHKLGGTEPTLRALAPDAEVFAKLAFSALGDEVIRRALADQYNIEHVILCGLETPICIYQTAIDARAAGWQVTLLSDAIGARRPSDADACVATLRASGVPVLSAETVFYSIVRGADHPSFKMYTELVKKYG